MQPRALAAARAVAAPLRRCMSTQAPTAAAPPPAASRSDADYYTPMERIPATGFQKLKQSAWA